MVQSGIASSSMKQKLTKLQVLNTSYQSIYQSIYQSYRSNDDKVPGHALGFCITSNDFCSVDTDGNSAVVFSGIV